MSRTIFPTVNTTGVRRYYGGPGLGAWGLGDVNDTAQGMISEGYDPGTISSLVALGASDAQLQSIWNNAGANTPDFSNAAEALMLQLATGGMTQTTGPTAPVIQPVPSGPITKDPWTGMSFTPSGQALVALPTPGGGTTYAPAPPPPPTTPINWSLWLQQNAPFIIGAIAVLAIVPPLVKKL